MTMLLLNVFGGLAIFIFGMKMMSDGLHRAAGERMRTILRFFSANRFVAILSGTVVTAVIQSSSASTVMVIGFVNAGLLDLTRAIGIIFGANIGTTITAQLVAFEISWIIMPSIMIGLALSFFARPVLNGWGMTVIGLGFLFLGMEYMSSELKSLSGHPAFLAAFQWFDCAPVNGSMPFGAVSGAIAIGLAATLLIQSSSACTGIIIALGAGGLINIYTAVALVLGSNIGTTVTAQLAALAANRVAKQAALAHTLFNVIGVVIVGSTFWLSWGSSGVPVFFRLVNWFSGSGDLPRHIANAHTLFNVFTTLLLVPFIPLLARVCEKLIPIKAEKIRYQRLEPHLLDTPAIALDQTAAMLRRMLKKSWKMAECALDTRKHAADPGLLRRLNGREEQVDELQHEITDYLAQLIRRPLSPAQAERIPQLLHCTNDAERIGDHTAVIVDLIARFAEAKGELSKAAEEELDMLQSSLCRQAECALALLQNCTPENIRLAAALQKEIPAAIEKCEKNHLKRLNRNQCSPVTGVFYIELLAEIDKVSRHLGNITERTASAFSPPQSGEAI